MGWVVVVWRDVLIDVDSVDRGKWCDEWKAGCMEFVLSCGLQNNPAMWMGSNAANVK